MLSKYSWVLEEQTVSFECVLYAVLLQKRSKPLWETILQMLLVVFLSANEINNSAVPLSAQWMLMKAFTGAEKSSFKRNHK